MKIYIRAKYPFLVYMLGFFLGILYLNLAASEYILTNGIWGEWFRSCYLDYDLRSFDYLWYIVKVRVLPAGVLAVLGGTKLRKISAYLFIGWIGMSCGLIMTLAVMTLGIKGIILCIVCMLPHYLCYVPAYVMLLIYLLHFPESVWNITKWSSFLLFMTMGIALECIVNPVLLKAFFRIM